MSTPPAAPFHHSPYGYQVVPLQFRTSPSQDSPPPATDSLGVLTLESSETDDSSFETDDQQQQQQQQPVNGNYQQQRWQHNNGSSARNAYHGSSSSTLPPPPSYNESVASNHDGSIPSSPMTSANSSACNRLAVRHQQTPSSDTGSSMDSPSRQPPSYGMDPSSPSYEPGSFKAHFALEKVGVPYHQFPNGGVIPTPAHWPQHCTIDTNSSHPKTYRAFIGQVRFETTTEQIAWVLEQVTGVTAAFVAYHRNGCFVAHFLTEDDCATAVSHHKKILFDLNGVWDVADTTNTSAGRVLNTILKNRAHLHRHHLPRGAMVIEPFATVRNQGNQGEGALPPYTWGKVVKADQPATVGLVLPQPRSEQQKLSE